MPAIELVGLTKRFGKDVTAVDGVDLVVKEGAFHTLLGPSGCGKTTTLRMIAGLEEPTSGKILMNERPIVDKERELHVPAAKRNLGFIFQHYALWPHMTVFENVAFGMRVRSVARADLKRRVENALARVRLQGYAERYPSELSGGQQQRVALARMLVVEPDLLLMDEPLSNLDAQLRMEMRSELKHIHLGTEGTTLYVTHDQVEAMTLSSQISIFKDGRIEQTGSPHDIYRSPANLFVAQFFGNVPMNLLPGRLVRELEPDTWQIALDGAEESVVIAHLATMDAGRTDVRGHYARPAPDRRVTVGVRPEDCHIVRGSADPEALGFPTLLRGRVFTVLFAGSETHLEVAVGVNRVVARSESFIDFPTDEALVLAVDLGRVHVFDGETTMRVVGHAASVPAPPAAAARSGR